MKEKTAIQLHIEGMEKARMDSGAFNNPEYTKIWDSCINMARFYLEKEKEQVMEAFKEGREHGADAASSFDWGTRIKEITANDYFNETYNEL